MRARNNLMSLLLVVIAAMPGAATGAPGDTELISVATNGAAAGLAAEGDQASAVSADGRFVAFVSYSANLVSGDTNGAPDVFVRDRLNGTVERISVSSAGVQGNGSSNFTDISDDGRLVVFSSFAPNLVAGDTNGQSKSPCTTGKLARRSG